MQSAATTALKNDARATERQEDTQASAASTRSAQSTAMKPCQESTCDARVDEHQEGRP